jgi:hypothetical protein
MTIKGLLTVITPEDYELLTYALEQGLDNTFIEYRPGKFVGVNIIPELMPHLIIEQTAGHYSAGKIERKS